MLTHPQSKRDDKDITISLLFVGRIVPLKGIHILILAVEEIIKQIDLRVWIVGPSYGPNYNGYEFMLKKMLERKHLRDTIIFTGNISEREVLQDYYLRADCFVLPSLTEGTPKAVLEAMSFGLPVIATRIGGLPNVVRDGIDGVLVTPGSKDELVNAIVRLSMNRHLRTTMGASGREHVNNFTKERVFNEIANLIRDKNRDEPNI
jgi:glycosyltransferase involved in cell wall biosynthesis